VKYSLKVWVVLQIPRYREEGILCEAAAGQDISPKEERNQDVFNKMVFNFFQECNGMLNTVLPSVFAGKIPRLREDGIS
jgi:hypothetical protein